MKARFRLTRSTEFKRVRRFGKSFAHPLVVLIVSPNETDQVRMGIVASRSVGGAVKRNRARRQIRAAIQPIIPQVLPGWDGILIARQPMTTASFTQIQNAVRNLFQRARILKVINDPEE